MDKKEQLIRLREQIKSLTYKLSNLPAVLRNQGMQTQVELLKQQEKELVKTMSDEELYGAEMAAQEYAQQSDALNRMKSKKTLVVAGGVAGFLLVSMLVGVIIYKKRKK